MLASVADADKRLGKISKKPVPEISNVSSLYRFENFLRLCQQGRCQWFVLFGSDHAMCFSYMIKVGKLLQPTTLNRYHITLKVIHKNSLFMDKSSTRREVRMPISECASSHMARRTFCGNLYKRVKDPNIVASMSGHKEGSKAFARYREIDKDIKRDALKVFEAI